MVETDKFMEGLKQNSSINLPPQERGWDTYASVAPKAYDVLREACALRVPGGPAHRRPAACGMRCVVRFRVALGALLDPFGSSDSVLLLEDLVEQKAVLRKWLPNAHMLADVLTKATTVAPVLAEFLEFGIFAGTRRARTSSSSIEAGTA